MPIAHLCMHIVYHQCKASFSADSRILYGIKDGLSGTLYRPTSSLPIIPAQNMTQRGSGEKTLGTRLTTLLSSHSWWFAAALYKSTSAPAIWSIEGCSALICEKNGPEVCFDILPIQVAHFCAWWLREGEYSISQAWQLCRGSRNE